MDKKSDKKTVTLVLDEDAKNWKDAQSNFSDSVRALIRMAIKRFGNADLIQSAVDNALENK